MIYTAPCIMFWMRAYPLRGEVGGGWTLELPSFLSPVKWERADRRVPFGHFDILSLKNEVNVPSNSTVLIRRTLKKI